MKNNAGKQEAARAVCEMVHIATDRSYDDLLAALSSHINQLINHDFPGLINLLYRMDIGENTLRESLANSPTNAGELVAELLIKRQLEKLESRRAFRQRDDQIPDEERW